jgi:uncharacterized RDD family membrane protein YckC
MDLFDDEEVALATAVEAGPINRMFAGLIDALIAIGFGVGITLLKPFALLRDFAMTSNTGLFIFIFLIVYRFLSILLLGGTIGMLIFHIKLLNGNMKALSLKENLLAAFFILYAGVNYYKK